MKYIIMSPSRPQLTVNHSKEGCNSHSRQTIEMPKHMDVGHKFVLANSPAMLSASWHVYLHLFGSVKHPCVHSITLAYVHPNPLQWPSDACQHVYSDLVHTLIDWWLLLHPYSGRV